MLAGRCVRGRLRLCAATGNGLEAMGGKVSLLERFSGDGGRRLLLEAMSEQELVARKPSLARALVERVSLGGLASGDVLIEEGAGDNDLYFVLAGGLSVLVGGKVVGTREAGQHVGEVALLDPSAARSATVVAREPTVVAKISEADFVAVAASEPEVWRSLAAGLSAILADRNRRDAGEAARSRSDAVSATNTLSATHVTAFLRHVGAPPADGGGWDAVLRPGAVFGRFELMREIGRGGSGVVWEARDLELRRDVAFKAMRRGVGSSHALQRLIHEAQATARLSHPNIVTLYDIGHAERGPYLVLELLRGETLARRFACERLETHEVLRIAGQIASALAYAHTQGVVHRDLKPTNIFLCEGGQLKVLDLGLALAFGGSRLVPGGTPAYMAPEQWRGAPEDERTDVFALGVLLYQMIAGTLPFRDPAAADRDTPPPLHAPGVPGLPQLVRRMLQPDPVARPRDGGEVLAELIRIGKQAHDDSG